MRDYPNHLSELHPRYVADLPLRDEKYPEDIHRIWEQYQHLDPHLAPSYQRIDKDNFVFYERIDPDHYSIQLIYRGEFVRPAREKNLER